jgi:Ca-activated chloride channel family protein
MTPVILFLTDGRPTVGVTDADEIMAKVRAANAGGRARIVAFGVGVDLNSVLLDRIALENHGVPTFVRPKEDVERKVASLYEKIRWPVLTDLRFEWRGVRATEVLPTMVPDLFRGGQVILAGRYGSGGRAEVVLRGKDESVEREFHYLLQAHPEGGGLANDFPARVWATRRIAQLIDEIRLKKREDRELVDEIVRLSTRFGILTEYTAFLADETVDLGRVADNAARARSEVEGLASKEVGGAGWAQSYNNGERRGAERPAAAAGGFYLGDEDDRDATRVEIEALRQVANRAFYRKQGAWVDAEVADMGRVDETVARWSPRFFELLRTTNAEENSRLSQSGNLVLKVQGRVLRIVEAG